MSEGQIKLSPAAAAARAHYESVKNQFVDIPEWVVEGKPLRVRWVPVTPAEGASFAGKSDVDILIEKARDSSGNALFTADDRRSLETGACVQIVARIVGRMTAVPTAETAEKN